MGAVNVGEVLGSYRITAQLGEGGVGVVYLASHKLIGREAAIKVLRPEFSSDQAVVDQFFEDAKTTTSLKHPGIVDIYDFGFSDRGSPYIVMERLAGESLRARMDRGVIAPAEAIRVARQVAGALGAAHERGVVHQSLKPDNIFLIDDPESPGRELAKVLDFGVSKLRGGNDASYMAPEQCLGSGRIDHRADLYALGCILFDMMCGRPPFVGTAVGQVLSAHVNMSPPPPRSIEPSISPGIERVVLRLLEKSPEKRYANAGVLAGALDEVSARMPDGPRGGRVAAGSVSLEALPQASKRDDSTVIAGGAVPAPLVQPAPPRADVPLVYGPPPGETEERYIYDGGIRKKGAESTRSAAAGVRNTTDDGARKSRKLGLLVVFLALAIGGVSAYFIATSTNVSAESETTPEIAASAGGEAKAGADPAEPEKAAESIVMVFVTISSRPEGAAVFLEDQKVGFTPYRAEVASTAGNSSYVLKLEGHKDSVVLVPGDRSSAETVAMERGEGPIPEPKSPPAPKKKKNKASTVDYTADPLEL